MIYEPDALIDEEEGTPLASTEPIEASAPNLGGEAQSLAEPVNVEYDFDAFYETPKKFEYDFAAINPTPLELTQRLGNQYRDLSDAGESYAQAQAKVGELTNKILESRSPVEIHELKMERLDATLAASTANSLFMASQDKFQSTQKEMEAMAVPVEEEDEKFEVASAPVTIDDFPEETRNKFMGSQVEILNGTPQETESGDLVIKTKIIPEAGPRVGTMGIGITMDGSNVPQETDLAIATKNEDGSYTVTDPRFVKQVEAIVGNNIRVEGETYDFPQERVDAVNEAVQEIKAVSAMMRDAVFSGEIEPADAEKAIDLASIRASKLGYEAAEEFRSQFYAGGGGMTKAQLDEFYKTMGLPTKEIPSFEQFYQSFKEVEPNESIHGRYEEALEKERALGLYIDQNLNNSNLNLPEVQREYVKITSSISLYEHIRELTKNSAAFKSQYGERARASGMERERFAGMSEEEALDEFLSGPDKGIAGFGDRFVNVIASALSAIPSMAGQISRSAAIVDSLVTNRPMEESAFNTVADKINEFIQQEMMNPGLENTWMEEFAGAGGSVAAFVLGGWKIRLTAGGILMLSGKLIPNATKAAITGYATTGGVMALSTAQSVGGQYDYAISLGLDEADAKIMAASGLLSGPVQVLNVTRVLDKVLKGMPLGPKKALSEALVSGAGEALAEGGGVLINEAWAKSVYSDFYSRLSPEEREGMIDPSEVNMDVLSNAEMGFGVGFILSLIVGPAARRNFVRRQDSVNSNAKTAQDYIQDIRDNLAKNTASQEEGVGADPIKSQMIVNPTEGSVKLGAKPVTADQVTEAEKAVAVAETEYNTQAENTENKVEAQEKLTAAKMNLARLLKQSSDNLVIGEVDAEIGTLDVDTADRVRMMVRAASGMNITRSEKSILINEGLAVENNGVMTLRQEGIDAIVGQIENPLLAGRIQQYIGATTATRRDAAERLEVVEATKNINEMYRKADELDGKAVELEGESSPKTSQAMRSQAKAMREEADSLRDSIMQFSAGRSKVEREQAEAEAEAERIRMANEAESAIAEGEAGATPPAATAEPQVTPTVPEAAPAGTAAEPRPTVDRTELNPSGIMASKILQSAGVDSETAMYVARELQGQRGDMTTDQWRDYVFAQFADNGGVLPEMRYSEDQEYYEMAFGIGPEEAATLVGNAKAQNALAIQTEIERNQQWRKRDESTTQTEQGIATTEQEAEGATIPTREVTPSPAIEERGVSDSPTEQQPTPSLTYNAPAELTAVANNTATPEQLQVMVERGLVAVVDGENVITNEGILLMPPESRPTLSEGERRAQIAMRKTQAEPLSISQQQEIQVGLTSATKSIPGIDRLLQKANAGDAQAAGLLRNIAKDSLNYLVGRIPGVSIEVTDNAGFFQGDREPSLNLRIKFDAEADRALLLSGLAKFAENFNQYQFHVTAPITGKETDLPLGHQFGDGSFITLSYTWEVNNLDEALSKIVPSGLEGASITGNQITVYYDKDPNDTQRINAFEAGVQRLDSSLGSGSSSYQRETRRLWNYGVGPGTIPYKSIRGDLYPSTPEASRTAQRIASIQKGADVVPTQQAKKLTPEQAELQTRISDAYESMRMDALDDPKVRRAYEELVVELLEQFDALPIKITTQPWSPNAEFYKTSEDMRRDVLENNQLSVLRTEAKSFGPEGITYTDHPLLRDSGRKDSQGYPLLMNDLLRAVHDYYAHTMSPVAFGRLGEEAAWRNHMSMTRSPWARWALTSETRGQNSYVNFGPDAEWNRKNPKETKFAPQKVDLLPAEFALTGDPVTDAALLEAAEVELLPDTTEQQREQFLASLNSRKKDATTKTIEQYVFDYVDGTGPIDPEITRDINSRVEAFLKREADQGRVAARYSDLTRDYVIAATTRRAASYMERKGSMKGFAYSTSMRNALNDFGRRLRDRGLAGIEVEGDVDADTGATIISNASSNEVYRENAELTPEELATIQEEQVKAERIAQKITNPKQFEQAFLATLSPLEKQAYEYIKNNSNDAIYESTDDADAIISEVESKLGEFAQNFQAEDAGAGDSQASGGRVSGQPEARESRRAIVTPQQDRDYLDAVERGDLDAASRVVEDAAKRAGYDTKNLLFHGTTHIFNVFRRDRANSENDFGKGYYFTNTELDAQQNYAGEGPDLTNRIERLSEQIQANEDVSDEVARQRAKEILSGGDRRMISAYIKMDNPFLIGGDNQTFLDFNEQYNEATDEYGEPTGRLVDFINNFKEIAAEYDGADPESGAQKIIEAAIGYDGVSAAELVKLLKEDGSGITYAEDQNGELAANEIIRRTIEASGFDGIVDRLVNQKFGTGKKYGGAMAGVGPETVHTIVFNSNQIKSADVVTRDDVGNIIPPSQRFQPTEADIRYARGQAGVGMTADAVRARLEALGFGADGMIRIVEDPQAAFEGRVIIQDGKAVRIELNASALRNNADIDRVLNHEFAEAANADGTLNNLVESLTPEEKKEINDAITRLGYEERVRTTEEAARAIEALAAGWKGRGFFERAVARVEAWASKLGFKLTRRASEYIAARNLADINAGFKTVYNRFINVRGEAREGRVFVTPEENARFLELAKDPEANREELQRMVDEAARRAGFATKAYHKTWESFNEFIQGGNLQETNQWVGKNGKIRTLIGKSGKGFFFSLDRENTPAYHNQRKTGERILDVYLKYKNPLAFDKDTKDWAIDVFGDENKEFPRIITNEAYDLVKQDYDSIEIYKGYNNEANPDEVIVLDPNQIKSADPVTYDNDGNVIPLDQRFQPATEDIRYSRTEIRESLPPSILAETKDNINAATMRVTPEQDAAYLAAVERGDMDTALDMVDEAVRASVSRKMIDPKSLKFKESDQENAKIARISKSFGTSEEDIYWDDQPALIASYGKGGELLLEDGHHRASAFIQNGFSSVPVIVVPKEVWGHLESERGLSSAGMTVAEIVNDSITSGQASYQGSFSQSSGFAAPVIYDKAGNPIPLSQRFNPESNNIALSPESVFSPDKAARHADLEAKHDAGTITPEEVAEAQRMVDEAARLAGSVEVYHGGIMDWTVAQTGVGDAVFFTEQKELAQRAADLRGNFGLRVGENRGVRKFFISKENILDATADDAAYQLALRNDPQYAKKMDEVPLPKMFTSPDWRYIEDRIGLSSIKEAGFDGVKMLEWKEGLYGNATGNPSTTYAIFYPNQIKSADPFTGVPLNQRFDTGNDIRGNVDFATNPTNQAEPTREGTLTNAAKRLRYKNESGSTTLLTDIPEAVWSYGKEVYRQGQSFVEWAGDMLAKFGESVQQFLSAMWDSLTGGNLLPHARQRGSVGTGVTSTPAAKPAKVVPPEKGTQARKTFNKLDDTIRVIQRNSNAKAGDRPRPIIGQMVSDYLVATDVDATFLANRLEKEGYYGPETAKKLASIIDKVKQAEIGITQTQKEIRARMDSLIPAETNREKALKEKYQKVAEIAGTISQIAADLDIIYTAEPSQNKEGLIRKRLAEAKRIVRLIPKEYQGNAIPQLVRAANSAEQLRELVDLANEQMEIARTDQAYEKAKETLAKGQKKYKELSQENRELLAKWTDQFTAKGMSADTRERLERILEDYSTNPQDAWLGERAKLDALRESGEAGQSKLAAMLKRAEELEKMSLRELRNGQGRVGLDTLTRGINAILHKDRNEKGERAVGEYKTILEQKEAFLRATNNRVGLTRRGKSGDLELPKQWKAGMTTMRSESALNILGDPVLHEIAYLAMISGYRNQLEMEQRFKNELKAYVLDKTGYTIGEKDFQLWSDEIVSLTGYNSEGTIKGKVKLTRRELWDIAAMMRDPDNLKQAALVGEKTSFVVDSQRLQEFSDIKFTPELLAEIDALLGDGVDNTVVDFLHKVYSRIGDEVLPVVEWVRGSTPERRVSYHPRERDPDTRKVWGQTIEDMQAELQNQLNMTAGFTKETSPNAKAKLVIRDSVVRFYGHLSSAARIKAYMEPATHAVKVLQDAEVIKRIRDRIGQEGYDLIFRSVLAQALPTRRDVGGKTFMDVLADRINEGMVASMLGLKLGATLMNPTGIPIGVSYLSGPVGDYVLKGSATAWGNRKKNLQALNQFSPYFRERYGVNAGFTQEYTDGAWRRDTAKFKGNNQMWYMAPIEFTDKIGGVYRAEVIREWMKGERKDLKEDTDAWNEEFARQWELIMFRSENTSHGADRTALLQKAANDRWFGTLVMFTSSVSKIMSAQLEAVAYAQMAAYSNDPTQKAESSEKAKKLMSGFLTSAVMGATIRAAIDVLMEEPDEEKDMLTIAREYVAKIVGGQLLGSIPLLGGTILGPLATSAITGQNVRPFSLSTWDSLAQSTYRTAAGLYKTIEAGITREVNEKGELVVFDEFWKTFRSAADPVGVAARLPLPAIRQYYDMSTRLLERASKPWREGSGNLSNEELNAAARKSAQGDKETQLTDEYSRILRAVRRGDERGFRNALKDLKAKRPNDGYKEIRRRIEGQYSGLRSIEAGRAQVNINTEALNEIKRERQAMLENLNELWMQRK